jgi:hypothetical protein
MPTNMYSQSNSNDSTDRSSRFTPIDAVLPSYAGLRTLADRLPHVLPTPAPLWTVELTTDADSDFTDHAITLTHAFTGPDAELTVELLANPLTEASTVYTLCYTDADGVHRPYADHDCFDNAATTLTDLVVDEFFPAHAPRGTALLTRLFA